jgi:pimeloyl-[acyl-carrier protein] synthase
LAPTGRWDVSSGTQAIEKGLRFELPLRIIGARHHDAMLTSAARMLPPMNPRWAFPEPDMFRLDRKKNPHLAFSAGPHFCMGAQLARLEACLAMDALVRRLPEMRLKDPEVRWRNLVDIHTLDELQVEW